MRLIASLLLCLLTAGLSAQREAANWYFGTHAGLDFNSGSPEVLLDGQIRTVEGCETFSDQDGNLIFYTEGNTVWNRFHEVMPNGTGLGGSFSTTQSALVVPNPGDGDIYYIFTPDDVLAYKLGSPTGFNYSIVDMSSDGGKGDVVVKNTDLLAQGSEKVTAIRGHDGSFYWAITQYRDSFYAYRVDATGVNETPVISKVGPLIDDFENLRGGMKISPDGRKIAIAHTVLNPVYKGNLYLFDFDVNTGRVNNPLALNDQRVYYGVEFSSNSTKLYASGLLIENSGSLGNLEIVQFDLNDPDVSNSIYTVGTFPEGYGNEVSGSLQLGIDKKIYHAVPENKLSVIRTPNLKGINSDFRLFEVDLGDRSATYGLPPFVQSFFETIVTIENFCEGQQTTFTTDSSGEVQSIYWNFGDPASGGNNVSVNLNSGHTFSSHGTYTVSLDVEYNNGTTRNFLEFVEIAEIPKVNSSIELVQCDVDGIEDGISQFNLEEAIELFGNNNDDMHALFFETMADATSNSNQLEPLGYTNLANGQTIYARAFENAECYTIVEIVLMVHPFSDLGTFKSITVCDETEGGLATFVDVADAYETISNDFPDVESLIFYATKENALLEQEELPVEKYLFGPFDERVLFFRLENENTCSAIGRLELEVIYKPRFEDEVHLNLCNGQVQLNAVEGFDGYSWSTGSNGPSISVDSVGQYDVTLFTDQCSYLQRFVVIESPEIEIDDIVVSDFKERNEISVSVRNQNENVRYSIDNGSNYQASNKFANLLPGVYNLVVTNDCITIERTIVVGGLDSFFTPNSDGINDVWSLANSEFFPDFKLSVYDRYGKLLSSFNVSNNGWDGTFNGKEMSSSDYWYRLELESGRVVHGHFSLKR